MKCGELLGSLVWSGRVARRFGAVGQFGNTLIPGSGVRVGRGSPRPIPGSARYIAGVEVVKSRRSVRAGRDFEAQ